MIRTIKTETCPWRLFYWTRNKKALTESKVKNWSICKIHYPITLYISSLIHKSYKLGSDNSVFFINLLFQPSNLLWLSSQQCFFFQDIFTASQPTSSPKILVCTLPYCLKNKYKLLFQHCTKYIHIQIFLIQAAS